MFLLVFLGLQKTLISSFLSSFFSIVNIIFSIYFVRYLNLDIFGVALGTVVSSYITIAVFSVFIYFYEKF